MSELASFGRAINRLEVSDARRKSKELIAALRRPSEDFPPPLNDELNRFGFHKTAFKDGAYEFDATGGKFTCIATDGVQMNVYVGIFDAGDVKTASGNLARFLMINATVDPSQFPMPEKKTDDEADRAYLRAVAEREKKLNTAKQLARDFNKTFANWFYVVDQEIISNLIPTLTIKTTDNATPAPLQTPNANPENSSNDATSEEDK